jgi:hypothetical protein
MMNDNKEFCVLEAHFSQLKKFWQTLLLHFAYVHGAMAKQRHDFEKKK